MKTPNTKQTLRSASKLTVIALASLLAASCGQMTDTQADEECETIPSIFGTWEYLPDLESADPDETVCLTDHEAYDTYEITDDKVINIRYMEGFEESIPYNFDGDMITMRDRVLYLAELTHDKMVLVERFDQGNDTLIFKRVE
ncbi:MAG: hypothetical protein K5864_01370 [Bacteroidales bacterium]|nr:hypothetical protein [Bacteroidales bacterium]